jgi:hypothetical protein
MNVFNENPSQVGEYLEKQLNPGKAGYCAWKLDQILKSPKRNLSDERQAFLDLMTNDLGRYKLFFYNLGSFTGTTSVSRLHDFRILACPTEHQEEIQDLINNLSRSGVNQLATGRQLTKRNPIAEVLIPEISIIFDTGSLELQYELAHRHLSKTKTVGYAEIYFPYSPDEPWVQFAVLDKTGNVDYFIHPNPPDARLEKLISSNIL